MASLTGHLLVLPRLPWNALAFTARRRLAWTRGPATPRHEDKNGLFTALPAKEAAAAERRERELRARYGLAPLRAHSTRFVYRENLYLLDGLESLFAGAAPRAAEGVFRAVDVGAQDWRYVYALDRFWRRFASRDVALDGVEIDGHGVYRDGHARADWARGFAAQTGSDAVRYLVGDFLAHRARGLDAITVFFPFVTRWALLRFGLPLSVYRPRELFARAVDALRPGGLLVVFHQTATERRRAQAFACAAGARLLGRCALPSAMLLHRPHAASRSASLFERPCRENADVAFPTNRACGGGLTP